MTDRIVDRVTAESMTRPASGPALPALYGEVLSQAALGSLAAILDIETASSPLPPAVASRLLAESVAAPWPPRDVLMILVEVVRRDTSAAAIVATGYDALGDRPWADAQPGVFAFRHDWREPLIERVTWQTHVVRLASGNEARGARRLVPRRLLTYRVGNARGADAQVADWLADHLGRWALWPLPQCAVHLSKTAESGAVVLAVGDNPGTFQGLVEGLRLTPSGLTGWLGSERLILIGAADGWQIARLAEVEVDRLWLAEPLARTAASGASVMPLVLGRAVDPAALNQLVPGIASGSVTASLSPQAPPERDHDDPLLDGIPVWPDGSWRDDPMATVTAAITRQDFSPADPWTRRDDPWPATAFQRRYLAATKDDITVWRRRLWYTQGRLASFWLPDALTPVLWVTHASLPEDGFVRVGAAATAAFWHRPAAALIIHPDGTRQHALTSTFHLDQGGVLVLRSELTDTIPMGSRVLRLARCRLDHDAIDLYWHSTHLVEFTLTARQLPEPRGNDRFVEEPA